MSEMELVARLKQEEADAQSFWKGELAEAQTKALERFYGMPYGDEVAGKSQVTTRNIQDAINWLMPDLMRMFQSSDELISVEPYTKADEDNCQPAADFMNHQFFRDNDGFRLVYDFAFDGLLQRVGIAAVTWEDPEELPPKIYEGVTQEQLAGFANDPSYQIHAAEQTGQAPVLPGLPQPQQQLPPNQTMPATWTLLASRTKPGYAKVRVFPPEMFTFSRWASCIEESDYIQLKDRTLVAELQKMFPDKAAQIETHSVPFETGVGIDSRMSVRFQGEAGPQSGMWQNDKGSGKTWVTYENVRVDFDGDGTPEWRFIIRLNDLILQNERIDEPMAVTWSPIHVPHKLVGLGLADQLDHYQKIDTELTRRGLDSLAQSLNAKPFINTSAIEVGDDGKSDTIDQIIDPAAVVLVNGNPNDVVYYSVTPDLSGAALAALSHFKGQQEQATGVGGQTAALDPQTLAKSQSGVAIDLLQAAASSRKEMIARELANGLERIFAKMLKLTCQHQDQARQLKIKGEWVSFDPRRWSDEMSVAVHVGLGAASRQTQIGNLSAILSKQETILTTAGPQNPIVSLKQYGDTLSEMAKAMGYRNTSKFFSEVPEPDPNAPPPQPPPDPKLVEVQAKAELAKQQAQTDATLAADKQQHETAQREAQATADMQLKRAQLAAEMTLKREQLAAELQLKREQMTAELELESEMMRRRADLAASVHVNGKSNGFGASGVHMGGEPG